MSLSSSSPDVVIVGAGTAGLSAAKTLKKFGYSVVVLEAAAFVGGRCITDNSTFKIPFDVGGSWLHSAGSEPSCRAYSDCLSGALNHGEIVWFSWFVSMSNLGRRCRLGTAPRVASLELTILDYREQRSESAAAHKVTAASMSGS